MGRVIVPVSLPRDLVEKIEEIANKENKTRSAIIKEAILLLLSNRESPSPPTPEDPEEKKAGFDYIEVLDQVKTSYTNIKVIEEAKDHVVAILKPGDRLYTIYPDKVSFVTPEGYRGQFIKTPDGKWVPVRVE